MAVVRFLLAILLALSAFIALSAPGVVGDKPWTAVQMEEAPIKSWGAPNLHATRKLLVEQGRHEVRPSLGPLPVDASL